MHFETDVDRVTQRYFDLADEALPGRIEGLYLVGSVALDDYQPGQSDIDFIAVTDAPLTFEEHSRLDSVHLTLLRDISKPWFDGIYVTWLDLGRDPTRIEQIASSHEGQFTVGDGFEANPSVWLTLSRYPRSLRGPAEPRVWHDADTIRRWNLDNLDSYWRGMAGDLHGALARIGTIVSRTVLDQAIVWCVPGVSRSHYTITQGDVTSKTGACRYALATFPERWHAVINEALALRTGEPVYQRSRAKVQRDLAEFLDFVVADLQ